MGLTTWPIQNFFPELKTGLLQFIQHQKDTAFPGYYSYSYSGDLFNNKHRSNLAGSIFALKLYYMLGINDDETINPLVARVLSFQNCKGEILDPYVNKKSFVRNLLSNLKKGHFADMTNSGYVRAETRQAYSALLLHDVLPKNVGAIVPIEPKKILSFLKRLDWSRPWGAGSHSSHLMFFLSLMRRIGQIDETTFFAARETATSFISLIQNESDGAWYQGKTTHRQKINGAMKVITGLAVDNIPFKYPEHLIDLCLAESTNATANACDQINQILVLRYADKLCDHSYRRDEIEHLCLKTIKTWQEYYHQKLGGFSFHRHHANDRYYGAKVSKGLDEPDIHGTVLFVWGLSMIKNLAPISELNFLREMKS